MLPSLLVLQAGKHSQEGGVSIARQFSEVIYALLLVVPMNSILAVSDTVMANVDEEEEDMQPEASTSGNSGHCRFGLHGITVLMIAQVYVHIHILVVYMLYICYVYISMCVWVTMLYIHARG